MKKFNCFFFSSIIAVVSCQGELERLGSLDIDYVSDTKNVYAISPDEALANLVSFLDESELLGTRSSMVPIISSITPIRFDRISTRSVSDDIDCDNLLYVANFEDSRGYAILAGDTRIRESVIAVCDTGSLSEATIYSAIELANEERPVFEGYPTTGPGFYTTEETGDELFMNPNTVSLYDETENDTYVGNFDNDEENDGNESADTTQTQGVFPSLLCVKYAMSEIRDNGPSDLPVPRQGNLNEGDPNDTTGPTDKRTEVTATQWTVKQNVSPMLSLFYKWSQKTPFNDLYPERRSLLIVGTKGFAPAGCFPLAIAKILTYFKYPVVFSYNGYTINWGELQYPVDSSAFGSQSAAYLLKAISSGCDCLYFKQGTFTFPSKATSYMRFIGLNNAHSYKYDFGSVVNMINRGCPIIIYSVPGIDVTKSHSWNIDGYKIKERTITTKVFENDILESSSEITQKSQMVHCDFGWQGKCNGYYVSGVFRLDDSNIEHDAGTSYGGSTNYNNFLRIITYDKP